MKIALTRTATAVAFSAMLAATAVAPALAQYYPGGYGNGGYNNGGYNNGGYNTNDRQITGTVQSFGGFNLTLSTGNGNYRGGYNNHNNNNNNGRWNQRDNDDNNDRDDRNDNNRGRHNGWNHNNGGGYNNGGYNGGGVAIHLHQGTIINPTGTTLQPGMNIRIWGHPNGDGSFEADRIDVNGNYGYQRY